LRETLTEAVQRRHLPLFAAEPCHTGDNAGMVAFAAWVDPAVQVQGPAELEIAPGLPLNAA
jgi:N6-L-threonylcarbamoyladenine synthase